MTILKEVDLINRIHAAMLPIEHFNFFSIAPCFVIDKYLHVIITLIDKDLLYSG